jgi:hypothetical protein
MVPLNFSDSSCDNPGHYICEYMPEIYLPAGDNGVTAAEGRARYISSQHVAGTVQQEVHQGTLAER